MLSMNYHKSVTITDYMAGHLYYYHLYDRPSACDYWWHTQQSVWMLYVWQTEYVLDIQSFFFFSFLLKLFLLHFSSAQINHLYEV